jgi:PAS domain S-box-containing protein
MKKPGKYIYFAILFILPLLFYPAIYSSGWRSSSDVHAMLEFSSSLLALTAGIMVLIHFLTTGNRSFLIISCGLILIGAEELVHGIFALERIWFVILPAYNLAITTTWLGGNLLLLISFLISAAAGEKEIKASNRIMYSILFNLLSFIAATILVYFIFNSSFLPDFVKMGSTQKKITELLMGTMFIIAFFINFRIKREHISTSPIIKGLISFLLIRALVHIYIAGSRDFYDANWDVAHLLSLLSYFFPILGVWAEMLKLHHYSQLKLAELAREKEEHMRAIEALQKSEEKLNHLFSNISDVIYSVDVASQEFNYLSPSFTRLTGYTFEDIKKTGGRKKFVQKVVDASTFKEWEEFLLKLDKDQSQKDFNYETLWHCKDGTYKYLSDHWIPIFVNGKIDSTYGILTDVTQRKLSEQILTNQNISLSRINQVAIGFSKLSFNDSLEDFITKQAKEISGASLVIFSVFDSAKRRLLPVNIETDEEYSREINSILADYLNGTQIELSEAEYQNLLSGTTRRMDNLTDASCGGISDPAGKKIQTILDINRFIVLVYVIQGNIFGTTILGMTSGLHDPSNEILENFNHFTAAALQQRHSEKVTRESEEKFRTLFEKAKDGIILINLNRDYILINEAFAKIHGYSIPEIEEIKLENLNTPETNSKAEERIRRILHGDTSQFVVTHYHKLGKIITLDVASSIINLGDDKYIIAFHRDITDKLIAEDELKAKMAELTMLNAELEKYIYANQELKQFTYIASHQLQEPIRTVSNFSNIIEEDFSEALGYEGVKHLHIIRDASKRMAKLIDSLLDYSQLGRNKTMDYIDCNKLVETVISDLDSQIDESKAEIIVNHLPYLHIYQVEFRQLFYNLLSNAIKFRKENTRPEVIISSWKQDDSWLFAVADNGIGIDPEHFEKIFDIFQRLHIDENIYKGKGIGLAYCNKIIQIHNGEIWVESEPGKGSTFYFSIPVINID